MSDDRLDEIIRNAARDYHLPKPAPRDEMWARIEQARRQAGVTAIRHTQRTRWVWTSVGVAAVLVIGFAIGQRYEHTQHVRVASAPDTPVLANTPGVVVGSIAPDSQTADSNATAPQPPNSKGATRENSVSPTPVRQFAGRAPTSAAEDPNAVPSHDDPTSQGLAFRLTVLQHLAGTEAMLTTFRTEAKSGEVDARLTTWARDLLRTTHLLQASSVASNDPTLKRLLDDLELVLLQIAQYTAKSPHRAEELELIQRSIEKRGVMAKLRSTNPAAPLPAGT
jgi:hypothetical protein